MKKIIIITDRFPESGGSRTEKFVKFLPEYGYEPIILTKLFIHQIFKKNERSTSNSNKNIEKALFIPSPFRIFNKLKLPNLTRKLDAFFFIPDESVTWLPFALIRAVILIAKYKINLIYSTSPHESNHLVALLAKKITGGKWVADFRDLWSTKRIKGANEAPTSFHNKIINTLEKIIMENADAIIANTENNKLIYVNEMKIKENKIVVIPNGYDGDDIHEIKGKELDFNYKKLSIGYNGFWGDPFPWREFFSIIERLSFMEDICVNICGWMEPAALQYIQSTKINKVVRYYGILTHEESLSLMLKNHILLLLLYETDFSDAIIPMKLYNYLAMMKPIMAIAGENGSSAKLIRSTNTGYVFSKSNPRQFEKKLEEFYVTWKTGGQIKTYPDFDIIKKYERKILTSKLADVFTTLI